MPCAILRLTSSPSARLAACTRISAFRRSLRGPVATVFGRAATLAHQRIEVEDVVSATLTFTNGAVGTLMASTAAYPGFPARLALHGARGSAVIEGDHLQTLAIQGRE